MKLRVLVSAYACEPGRGSEPGVGWNWARQISRFHEAWVITRANNRPVIEEALANDPLPNVHFVYYDLPRWARFWKKGSRGAALYYYLWQFGAYLCARKLHREVGFNLVHHVTFVKYWAPSFLSLLPAPFIWGPVGGGESAPRQFWSSFSLWGKSYELLRDLGRVFGDLDPFVRLTARRAALALATTVETEKRLRPLGCRNTSVFPSIGLTEEEIEWLGSFPQRDGNPFRLLSLGNLLHLKGFEFGLKAFAQLCHRRPSSEYWIIGDGPERKNLERLVEELGVKANVTFLSAMPRDEVLPKLGQCDVLVHPSLHDSGGWVCLEAMAAGVPVVCLDIGGPGLEVTHEAGIKVSATSPKQVVREVAAALITLAGDPFLRARLGRGGRQRVAEHFSWESKAAHLFRMYQQIQPSSCLTNDPEIVRPQQVT